MLARRESMAGVASLSLAEIHSLFTFWGGMIDVGDGGQVMLMANSGEALAEFRQSISSSSEGKTTKKEPSDDNVGANPKTPTSTNITFPELEARSQILGTMTDSFTNKTIQGLYHTSSKIHLPLKEWLSASSSRILWIYGPSHTDRPSHISSASAFVVSMITHAQAPLIAHRCQNSGSAIEALISMVYSVIVQLVWLVPERFSTDKDFSPDRFNMLDRSLETLPHALVLMDDLLTLSPRLLVVVLDGMQLCEDGRGGDKGTGEFLDVFLEILRKGKNGRVLKALFTTDGVCNMLWGELEPEERVSVMLEGGGAAGRRRRGRVATAGMTVGED